MEAHCVWLATQACILAWVSRTPCAHGKPVCSLPVTGPQSSLSPATVGFLPSLPDIVRLGCGLKSQAGSGKRNQPLDPEVAPPELLGVMGVMVSCVRLEGHTGHSPQEVTS